MRTRRIPKYRWQENAAGYAFIGLFIIGFLTFMIIPILSSLFYSFTNYNILDKPKFVGLENYIRMFTDDRQFRVSMKATSYYVLFGVPLKLIFALAIAMLFKKTTRATAIYRAAVYLPSIIGGSVAIAVVWRTMFQSDGLVNAMINRIFNVNITTSWIGGLDTAIWTLIALTVWQFGSSMLTFLSGLKQIPEELYESASVDGAGKIRSFFGITLPLLTPTIFFNLVMQTIMGFMTFTQSYVITQGGPMDRTLFMTVYIYRTGFTDLNMGYASAMAWVLLMLVAIVTYFLFKYQDRWVFSE